MSILIPDNLIEELAFDIHVIWESWSRKLAKSEKLSSNILDRWSRLWTSYYSLPEEEKQKDRVIAFDILSIILEYIDSHIERKDKNFTSLITVPSKIVREDILLFPMVYRLSSYVGIYIPHRLRTDYASTPRIFWSLLPPRGVWSKAAVLHDYLYKMNGRVYLYRIDGDTLYRDRLVTYTKKECDKLLYYAMLDLGINKLISKLFYRGVLFGGNRTWKHHLTKNYKKLWGLEFPSTIYLL